MTNELEARSLDSLPDLLTIEEVADFLQISKNTLYFWRQKGDGPPALSLGRHLRFPKEDLRGWLSGQYRAS